MPLIIGGVPDAENREVRGAIRIPKLLSFLAHRDPDAVTRGLNDFPEEERPTVLIAHLAFQVMVGSGLALVGLGLAFWWVWWRRRGAEEPAWLLRALVAGSPLGFLALQAGWIVIEVGRQPWVIYQVMLTRDAVTPISEVPAAFWAFSVFYLLGIALVVLLRQLVTGRATTASYLS